MATQDFWGEEAEQDFRQCRYCGAFPPCECDGFGHVVQPDGTVKSFGCKDCRRKGGNCERAQALTAQPVPTSPPRQGPPVLTGVLQVRSMSVADRAIYNDPATPEINVSHLHPYRGMDGNMWDRWMVVDVECRISRLPTARTQADAWIIDAYTAAGGQHVGDLRSFRSWGAWERVILDSEAEARLRVQDIEGSVLLKRRIAMGSGVMLPDGHPLKAEGDRYRFIIDGFSFSNE